MEPLLLPPLDNAEKLLEGPTRLVAARGPGPLAISPTIQPTKQNFTDRWNGTPRGAELFARRLLGYAGINHLEAIVDADAQLGMFANSTQPDRHKILQRRSVQVDEG